MRTFQARVSFPRQARNAVSGSCETRWNHPPAKTGRDIHLAAYSEATSMGQAYLCAIPTSWQGLDGAGRHANKLLA
jgi:hypothetical protein